MNLTDLILNEGKPSLFKKLNDEETEVVKERTNTIVYEPNQKIITAGDWGDSLYVLFQGVVNINHPGPNGKYRTTHQMTTGDFFGEMALMEDEVRSAAALAKDHSRLLGFFRPDLETLIEINPSIV